MEISPNEIQNEIIQKLKNEVYVSKEVYDHRMSVCKSHISLNGERYLTEDGMCLNCGCDMIKKNKFKNTTCPSKLF